MRELLSIPLLMSSRCMHSAGRGRGGGKRASYQRGIDGGICMNWECTSEISIAIPTFPARRLTGNWLLLAIHSQPPLIIEQEVP
jgi:hypothetical protein